MFKKTRRTTYLIVDNEHPCAECNKPTDQIDVFFEVRMCSDKCVKVWDDDMNNKLKELSKNELQLNDNWENIF